MGRSVPNDDYLAADETIFRTNAWCGKAASSERGAGFDQWGMKKVVRAAGWQSLSSKSIDYTKWQDPRVGWGIVLPDRDVPPKDKARAADAPECIRKLLAERGKKYAAR